MTIKEQNVTEDQIKALPERKKPAIKKPAVTKTPSKQTAVKKKSVAKPIIIESIIEPPRENKKVSISTLVGAIVLTLLFSGFGGYQIGLSSSSTKVDMNSTTTFNEVVAGKVALSEYELISAVKKLGVTVYWAGPVKGAKYTLSVPSEGQAYVRYLPNGQGLADTNPNYVVIATYATTNAFDATQSAGNTTNGITFINTDGAAVYYNKETATNVYVAYPGKDFQIEVFDPIAKTALEIASRSGALKLVG